MLPSPTSRSRAHLFDSLRAELFEQAVQRYGVETQVGRFDANDKSIS
jgi:hypothetical protein